MAEVGRDGRHPGTDLFRSLRSVPESVEDESVIDEEHKIFPEWRHRVVIRFQEGLVSPQLTELVGDLSKHLGVCGTTIITVAEDMPFVFHYGIELSSRDHESADHGTHTVRPVDLDAVVQFVPVGTSLEEILAVSFQLGRCCQTSFDTGLKSLRGV